MRRRKRKMELVESDQEVLAYRDTSTNTLFSWRCAPREPIRVFRQNKPEMTFDIYPTMERFLKNAREATGAVGENPWAQWGIIVGCFRSFCENFTHIEGDLEDKALEAEIIKTMEQQFPSPEHEEN